MSRFVGVEVGFWRLPCVLDLTFRLSLDRRAAGALILELRELFLNHSEDGTLRGWNKRQLAVALEFPPNKAETLMKALRQAGILAADRSGIRYRDWAHTITGKYQAARLEDAAEKRARRGASRVGNPIPVSGDSPGTIPGQSGDSPLDVPGMSVHKKERKKERTSPDAPKGESDFGFADWFERYPNPWNPERSADLWAGMTPEQRQQAVGHLSLLLKKNPRFVPQSDKYLRGEGFRVWRGRLAAVSQKAKEPTGEELAAAAQAEADRVARSWEKADKEKPAEGAS